MALKRNSLECIISPTAMISNIVGFCTHQQKEADVHVKRQRKQKFLKKMNQEMCALRRKRWIQELGETFPK